MRGRLIAVTGPGGTGASVTAMAIAQAFAAEAARPGAVLLADLRLDAEQSMLHDTREVAPGVQELTDAHRAGRLAVDQVRSLSFEAVGRGYHLLLGLRRHRDWTAIRPRAFAAALDGMLASYPLTVADVDPDTEDEEATGSLDVEDRNTMARRTIVAADAVVVVGNPTTKGIHALARVVRELARDASQPETILPVFARSPRGPRRRAEVVRSLAALLDTDGDLGPVGNPVFLSERADVEAALRDGERLPPQLGRPLYAELLRRLDAVQPNREEAAEPTALPVRVEPGTLGSWAEEVG